MLTWGYVVTGYVISDSNRYSVIGYPEFRIHIEITSKDPRFHWFKKKKKKKTLIEKRILINDSEVNNLPLRMVSYCNRNP